MTPFLKTTREKLTPPILGLHFGLLTHEHSQYPKKPFLSLFQDFRVRAKTQNIQVTDSISDRNLFSARNVRFVDLLLAQIYEPLLIRSWSAYLNGARKPKFQKNNLRIVLNCLIYLTKLSSIKFKSREKKKYSRILNINKGYLQLLKDFIGTPANLGIIFEDDASLENSEEVLTALLDLVYFTQTIDPRKFFIDLSDSFTFTQLGVDHLIEPEKTLLSPKLILGNTIQRAKKPFTNTTCAVLYSREMAELLIREIEGYATKNGKRIIPMDWSFNMVLLEAARAKTTIECFHLDPGLFDQKSLRT